MLLVAFHPVVESGPGYLSWTSVLHGIGLAAVLTGNAMALVQRRFKRMAAYLAAGQAGLVLTTVAAAGDLFPGDVLAAQRAAGGILVFLGVYVVNWVGLFVAASAVEDPDGSDPTVDRLQGLAHRHPWLAAAIGLALLCMAGMPLTAGFFARLVLLEAMVDAGWTGTAVLTALSLGLVLVMTLGLVSTMVLRPGRQDVDARTGPGIGLVAVLSSVTILLLGLLPGGILDVAIRSSTTLLSGP
jgi:NADH-quinone oxidoreductase subunit N